MPWAWKAMATLVSSIAIWGLSAPASPQVLAHEPVGQSQGRVPECAARRCSSEPVNANQPDGRPRNAMAPLVATSADTPGIDAPTPGRASASAPQSAKPSARLLALFNAGTPLKAFLAEALKHPEQGGAYYALHVLSHCRAMRTEESSRGESGGGTVADSPVDGVRRAAIESRKRRCDGFVESEHSEARDQHLLKSGLAGGDPLLKASDAFSKARRGADKNARVAALRQVLDTGDPLLLDGLDAGWFLQHSDDLGLHFHFQGVDYALRSDADMMHAFYLLPCGLGLVCDAHEEETEQVCALTGTCHASRFEDLKRQMIETPPGSYEKIVRLYEKMVVAAKAGDATAWTK